MRKLEKTILVFTFDIITKIIFMPLFFTRKSGIGQGLFKKILVIELWGIGDIVVASPAFSALKSYFPNAEIILLAKEHAREVLKHNSGIDRFIIYNFPWTKSKEKYSFWRWNWKELYKLIKRLRQESFDMVLDARGDFRNNILIFLTGAKRRISCSFMGGTIFLTNPVPHNQKNKYRLDIWKEILEYLNLTIKNFDPKIYISQEEAKFADNYLNNAGIAKNELLVGIHPGARQEIRRWSLENFSQVAKYIQEKYKAKVIVFTDPDGYGREIGNDGMLISENLNLRQLIALISKIGLLICNDSGPMHIAGAVGVPVVAIFGPGDHVVFGPHGEKDRIVRKEDITCSPCYDHCWRKEPYCLKKISVSEVIEVVDSALGEHK